MKRRHLKKDLLFSVPFLSRSLTQKSPHKKETSICFCPFFLFAALFLFRYLFSAKGNIKGFFEREREKEKRVKYIGRKRRRERDKRERERSGKKEI